MSRLTKLENENHYYTLFENSDLAMQKLGQLEDIEEELGIELLTIRDAFVNGFYIIDHKDKVVFVRPNDAYPDFECHAIYSYVYNQEDMIYYFFKDYNKTWALTEEELENESTEL